MCGIAGIIYRDGARERRARHDPDAPVDEAPRARLDRVRAVRRRATGSSSCATRSRTRTRRATSSSPTASSATSAEVEQRLQRRRRADRRARGRRPSTPTACTLEYDGDLKELADYVEDVPDAEVLSLGHSLEIVKDLGDAETVADQYRPRRLQGHARDRPRAHGDRVRRRHLGRAPLLGLSVLGRRRRPQRPAHELLPVEAAPRALGPPLPVRVRLARSSPSTSPRRWARASASRTRCAQSLEELDGVFTYICVTDDALGVAKDEMAAKPLVLYEARRHGRARLRGDRDPRHHRPRDRHATTRTRGRCWYGRGTARAASSTTRAGSSSPTTPCSNGLRDRRTGTAEFDARRPDDAPDQPRAALAALRAGHHGRHGRNPGAKHSLGVGILTRCKITLRRQPRLLRLRPDRRARDPHQRPGRLVGVREHDVAASS